MAMHLLSPKNPTPAPKEPEDEGSTTRALICEPWGLSTSISIIIIIIVSIIIIIITIGAATSVMITNTARDMLMA